MADRYTYVASIGFCMTLAYLLLKLFRINISENTMPALKAPFILTIILLLGMYSFLTIVRNAQWKNHLTLMRHDIEHLDKSAQAHNLLAQNIMKYSYNKEHAEAQKMYQEAIYHFKKSTEIYPDFLNTWYDMGRVYLMINDKENAYNCFIRAHKIDSTFTDATLNIAKIAEEKKDFKAAIRYYESAINNSPATMIEAYDKLSYLYYRMGKLEKSIEVNKKAIQYFPNYKEPYLNIALVYLELKDTANAYFYQKEAQKIK
jgi:tetratricopeptide (TPR) repeat protein